MDEGQVDRVQQSLEQTELSYAPYVAVRLEERYAQGDHVADFDPMSTYETAKLSAEMIAVENPDRRVAIYRLVATLVAPVGAIQIEEVD